LGMGFTTGCFLFLCGYFFFLLKKKKGGGGGGGRNEVT